MSKNKCVNFWLNTRCFHTPPTKTYPSVGGRAEHRGPSRPCLHTHSTTRARAPLYHRLCLHGRTARPAVDQDRKPLVKEGGPRTSKKGQNAWAQIDRLRHQLTCASGYTQHSLPRARAERTTVRLRGAGRRAILCLDARRLVQSGARALAGFVVDSCGHFWGALFMSALQRAGSALLPAPRNHPPRRTKDRANRPSRRHTTTTNAGHAACRRVFPSNVGRP